MPVSILNRQMFTTRLFDSGALGVLASVIHQFAEPGLYHAVIRRGEEGERTVSFQVSASSANPQLDIDLAAPTPDRARRERDCHCAPGETSAAGATGRGSVPTVSPKGYVLFYVSHGNGGYSVRVGREGGKDVVFDSTTLAKGDLFALSLLAPTRYSMQNRLGRARGSIQVALSEEAARNLAALETTTVEVGRDAFRPAEIEVVSGQGIVFTVADEARIVIEQAEEPPPGGERKRRHHVVLRPPEPRPRKR